MEIEMNHKKEPWVPRPFAKTTIFAVAVCAEKHTCEADRASSKRLSGLEHLRRAGGHRQRLDRRDSRPTRGKWVGFVWLLFIPAHGLAHPKRDAKKSAWLLGKNENA